MKIHPWSEHVSHELAKTVNAVVIGASMKAYQANFCIHLQVTYFKQRRVMEHNRQKTLEKLQAEGARPIDEALAASPQPSSTTP